MATQETIQNAVSWLCSRCLLSYIFPKCDYIDQDDDSVFTALSTLLKEKYSIEKLPTNNICPSCIGLLCSDSIACFRHECQELLNPSSAYQTKIAIQMTVEPIYDLARVVTRTILTENTVKSFPTADARTLFERALVGPWAKSFHVVPTEESQILVDISVTVSNQVALSRIFSANDTLFLSKKRKLDADEPDSSNNSNNSNSLSGSAASTDESQILSRNEVDKLLGQLKRMTTEELMVVKASIQQHFESWNTAMLKRRWNVKVTAMPFFVLGRYLKFARDVPQAAWTADGQRKGRNSVEEIVCGQAQGLLSATSVCMHSCGREDIDVRCLGNGRPFVLEVRESQLVTADAQALALESIMDSVNSQQGLNSAGDVSISHLRPADRNTWTTMQAVAEEKKKAYRCVVWCQQGVTTEQLNTLTSLTDLQSNRFLEITQRTPLRVLHRRSLMDRKREISHMAVVQLNPHYFMLDLVTSAGTYVKEFVHGDLNRTVPSVSSLLGCQADILQLDVVYLFDDFPGGGSVEAYLQMQQGDHESRSLAESDNLIPLSKLRMGNNISFKCQS